MTALNLVFSPNGIGSCFYTEEIDLATIGSLEITRATTIEFNQQKQEWEVRTSEGDILYANPSRQNCLVWERQHFNEG